MIARVLVVSATVENELNSAIEAVIAKMDFQDRSNNIIVVCF